MPWDPRVREPSPRPGARVRGWTPARAALLGLAIAWVLSGAYVFPFAFSGWHAHDEGVLAQSAQRVLQGELPHADFVDPYTGLLAYLHAGAFELWGERLASLRILLFLAYLCFVPILYWIGFSIAGAWGGVASVAVASTWSVACYFAGVPSWYNLMLATAGIGALLRHAATGRRAWLIAAGAAGGLSFLIKSAGVFYALAAFCFLVHREQEAARGEPAGAGRAYSIALCGVLAAIPAAVAWVTCRPFSVENAIHFVLPALAVCAFLALREWRLPAGNAALRARRMLGLLVPFGAGFLAPIAVFALPYLAGGELAALVEGLLIRPQGRLQHAVYPLPPWQSLVTAAPFAAVLGVGLFTRARREGPRLVIALVAAAVLFQLVRHGDEQIVHLAIWYSLRALPPVVAIFALLRLSGLGPAPAPDAEVRQRCFLLVAMVAFLGLIQFPYSFGIYFCYFAPVLFLAVLQLVRIGDRSLVPVHVAFLVFYLVFAAAWVHRGRIESTGVAYLPTEPRRLFLPERAGLQISVSHAELLEELLPLIAEHGAESEYLYAAPDCPELQFLAGKKNPMRTFYDFMEAPGDRAARVQEALRNKQVRVGVINHFPEFSPPLGADVQEVLRRELPESAAVGQYEVRWKP